MIYAMLVQANKQIDKQTNKQTNKCRYIIKYVLLNRSITNFQEDEWAKHTHIFLIYAMPVQASSAYFTCA